MKIWLHEIGKIGEKTVKTIQICYRKTCHTVRVNDFGVIHDKKTGKTSSQTNLTEIADIGH